MLTWEQLRDLKRSELSDAADGWGKVSNRARAALTRAESEMSGSLTTTQKSDAATAAVGRIKRLERNFQYIHTECGLVRSLLDGLATELAAPQRKLQHALEDAAGLKFTVGKDGSVTYPTTGQPSGTADPDPNKGKADGIAHDIADAVREANEIDGRYSSAIAALKAPPGIEVTDAMLADAKHDMQLAQKAAGKYLDKKNIPVGKSPAEVKKWWAGLTPEQRAEYTALYPAAIGALDGLPSTVRDDANRTVLAETRGETLERLHHLGPEPKKYVVKNGDVVVNEAWQKWHDEKTRLQDALKGMDAIQNRFDETGKGGLPEAYLLGFDTRGNGHAIIANGNPDTAQNTAIYVPGTTSRLGKIGSDTNRMVNLWLQGHAQDPTHSLSTITWLGYDAPQSIFPDATKTHWATDGAPKLNQFLDGMQTVQGGANASHTTLIGHSYGSTTIGAAAKAGHLAADDIVVAGSPGMLVGNASDLDVPKHHVWSEAADGDPVPEAGRRILGGHKEKEIFGIHIPFTPPEGPVIPDDPAFGAHIMDTDTKGHSAYWDPSTQSLKNQASVVTGQYNQVQEEPKIMIN